MEIRHLNLRAHTTASRGHLEVLTRLASRSLIPVLKAVLVNGLSPFAMHHNIPTEANRITLI